MLKKENGLIDWTLGAEPFSSGQGQGLDPLLARHQAQVGVDDLEFHAIDVDRDPQRAARLQTRKARISRQPAGLDQPFRTRGEQGVTVEL